MSILLLQISKMLLWIKVVFTIVTYQIMMLQELILILLSPIDHHL